MHDVTNYATSISPFESGKSGKEQEKIQKFEYLENENSFLDKIKTFSTLFDWLSFGEKNKNLNKNSGQRL